MRLSASFASFSEAPILGTDCNLSLSGDVVIDVRRYFRHRIYCGGSFGFDPREEGFEALASNDYRAILLDSVETMLRPEDISGVSVSENVLYIGPFYFETENMEAEDIIRCEMKMIEDCTDAIFLLDAAECPGTVAELMYANSLGKRLHLFYIKRDEQVETESDMHTPCWYPLHFCKMTNRGAVLYPCAGFDDAVKRIQHLVHSLS